MGATRLGDQRLVFQPAVNPRQELGDAAPIGNFAAVVAPRRFVHVAVQMLSADPMVNAVNLALEKRPRALDGVHMGEVVLHVLAGAVVDGVVPVALRQAAIAGPLVGHEVRARRDVPSDLGLGFTQALERLSAELTAALDHAEHDNLAALAPAVGVLVLVLASKK